MQSTAFHRSKYLRHEELLGEHQKCPICKSKEIKKQIILQTEPLVELCKCECCCVSFASRFPSDKAVSEYYENYYDEGKDSKVTNDDHKLFSSHIYSLFNKFDLKSKKYGTVKLLDYGGGDGSILLSLAEKFFSQNSNLTVIADVVDFESTLVESSNTSIIVRKIDEADIIDNTYDFVIASAVFEHLVDPITVSEKLISSIKHGGGIYIRTPYMLPIIKLFRCIGIEVDFTFPAHLYDMGEDFWNWFSKRSGLEVVTSKPSKIETSFKKNFLRTLVAFILKSPWYILKNKYSFVGGWEIVYRVNKK